MYGEITGVSTTIRPNAAHSVRLTVGDLASPILVDRVDPPNRGKSSTRQVDFTLAASLALPTNGQTEREGKYAMPSVPSQWRSRLARWIPRSWGWERAHVTRSAGDITRHRQGTLTSFVADDFHPTVRAATVLFAFAEAKPGDHFIVGEGDFDFGTNGDQSIPLPLGCSLTGYPSTRFLASVHTDAAGKWSASKGHNHEGPAFLLQDNVIESIEFVEDIYARPLKDQQDEDGICVGFETTESLNPAKYALLRGCTIRSNDWAVYNWNNNGNYVTLTNCDIHSGRHCVSAAGSGGSRSQFFDLWRCRLFGDASLSDSVGATSSQTDGGVFGVVARGGSVRLLDCEMDLKGAAVGGSPVVPRVVGVTDTYGTPNSETLITVVGLRCRVTPNGADPTQCFDFDVRDPKIKSNMQRALTSGSGSGGGTGPSSFTWRP
jgi:hypothetical protein